MIKNYIEGHPPIHRSIFGGLGGGFFRGEPRPLNPETREKVNTILTHYARIAIDKLHPMVRKGEGRGVMIAPVEGRPEDEELGIDLTGERILETLARDSSLRIMIIGEHRTIHLSGGHEPEIYLSSDPFDNSSEYKRGLDTNPYTVAGAYDRFGNPLGSVVGDINDRKAYMCIDGKNYLLDLESGERSPMESSKRTSIADPTVTIATYLGSNRYSLDFVNKFYWLLQDMHPKGRLYAGGGAYIYGLIASGAVDAYVMFNEPRGEIDPGLPLALAAGCTVVSVHEDGTFENYEFDPRRKDDVPLFIAAATTKLRDEIIAYYLKGQRIIRGEEDNPSQTVFLQDPS